VKTVYICPYCGAHAPLVDSAKVYGKSYGLIYLCGNWPSCDAYVGVHKGTDRPLGRMADKELRAWKVKAHAAFDPLWKSGKMTRKEAYQMLAEKLGIEINRCHIGMFDAEMCRQVTEKLTEEGKK